MKKYEKAELIRQHTRQTSWEAIGGGEVVAELYYTNADGEEIFIGELHGLNGTRDGEDKWEEMIKDKSEEWINRVYSDMEADGCFQPLPKEDVQRRREASRRRCPRRRK